MPDNTGSRTRVLVVDDNADAMDMLRTILESSGIEVESANDSLSAIGVFIRFRPHVVLLDLGIPGMDGLEVCRHLRRTPEGAAAIIAFVSGYTQDEYEVKAIEAGANRYFVKPVDARALLELVMQGGG